VGAWTFVAGVGLLYALQHGDGPGAFFAVLLLLLAGGVVALVLLGSLVVALAGAVAAIPLYAIWRGERAADESSDSPERFAIFHLLVAWAALAYVLFRLLH
jgi:hypothetical protein